MSELSVEQLIGQRFNFTDMEEVEPIETKPLPELKPNPVAELNVTRALPMKIQGLIAPITDPGPVSDPYDRSEEHCPLCGAPADWDD